jgi:cation/acetate symporter
MTAGLGLTIYYTAINATLVRSALGLSGSGLWFGIQPVSAGIFGILAGLVVTVLVSLLWPLLAVPSGRGSIAGGDGI